MTQKPEFRLRIVEGPFHGKPDIEVGWGNGYVSVPPDHPWAKEDDLTMGGNCEIKVHGGVTFHGKNIEGMDVIGFDTAHLGDNDKIWDRKQVALEAFSLLLQALAAYEESGE